MNIFYNNNNKDYIILMDYQFEVESESTMIQMYK